MIEQYINLLLESEVKTTNNRAKQELISILINLFEKIFFIIFQSTKKRKYDKELSDEISQLIGKKIDIYLKTENNFIQIFNLGTGSIYYSLGIRYLLTREELIAVILNDYYSNYKINWAWKKFAISFVTATVLDIFLKELLPYPKVAGFVSKFLISIGMDELLKKLDQLLKPAVDDLNRLGYYNHFLSAKDKIQNWSNHFLCNDEKCKDVLKNINNETEEEIRKNLGNILKQLLTKASFGWL